MKLYNINSEYIKFLRQFDNKILYNTKAVNSRQRVYTGIVFNIHNIKYFAPLSSPKPNKQIFKKVIYNIKDGSLGHILLNNMVPCNIDNVSIIDFKLVDDIKYRSLLINQYKSISINEESILKKANMVYKNVVVNKIPVFIKSCCNFKLLEEVYNQFINN